MRVSPYKKFVTEELILRDELAIDRTILANENALLAYIRTALAFFIAGASLIHFFGEIATQIVGYLLLIFGLLTFGIGLKRFRKVEKEIESIRTQRE